VELLPAGIPRAEKGAELAVPPPSQNILWELGPWRLGKKREIPWEFCWFHPAFLATKGLKFAQLAFSLSE